MKSSQCLFNKQLFKPQFAEYFLRLTTNSWNPLIFVFEYESGPNYNNSTTSHHFDLVIISVTNLSHLKSVNNYNYDIDQSIVILHDLRKVLLPKECTTS